mgnify:FL=1
MPKAFGIFFTPLNMNFEQIKLQERIDAWDEIISREVAQSVEFINRIEFLIEETRKDSRIDEHEKEREIKQMRYMIAMSENTIKNLIDFGENPSVHPDDEFEE